MSTDRTWSVVRILLAVVMLILAAQAAANQDPALRGIVASGLRCVGVALVMAALPMVVPRYRSLQTFSWLLLLAAFFQLYAQRDGLIGEPSVSGCAQTLACKYT